MRERTKVPFRLFFRRFHTITMRMAKAFSKDWNLEGVSLRSVQRLSKLAKPNTGMEDVKVKLLYHGNACFGNSAACVGCV